MPTNFTAATALDINTANAAYVAGPRLLTETFFVPDVTDLWFVRTAVATEVLMAWAMASTDDTKYSPLVSIFTGTPSALTPYLSFAAVSDAKTIDIPVTPGVTYYFHVTNFRTPVVSVQVTLSITATYGPRYAAPVGTLITNADVDDRPAALIDATGAITILQYKNLPQGESAAVLADGTIMIQNQQTNHPEIYSATLTLVTVVSSLTVPGMVIGSDRSANFYVAAPTGAIVYKVSKTGVVSGTSYGPLATGVSFLQAKADNSILYYHTSGASAITTWTTATNLAGANFAAAVAGYRTSEMLVMSDASVVVGYNKLDNTITKLYQYSAAGATVHAYTLDRNSFNHSVQGIDDPDSVWVWFQSGGTDYFEHIKLSDGSTITPPGAFTVPRNAAGIVSSGQFGIEGSCPLLILGPFGSAGGVVGTGGLPSLGALPGMGLTDPIRVVRRWALPFDTNLQVFGSRLEVLIQSGVGLTAGPSGSPVQGEDPTIMLRISKDGGKTWGNEQWRGMGKIGEYLARPYWNRLGRGRNLVAEIVCTDPVFVSFLDAFIDAEVGSS